MTRSLAARLREETRPYHIAAERSGVMRRLLTRSLDRATYVALLANLVPVYDALESALSQRASHPVVAPFFHRGLARVGPLQQDLRYFEADSEAMEVTDAARAYARSIRAAAVDPARLVAHSYVRYLGDMSGGQILKKLVREGFSLPPGQGTAFYEFAEIEDLEGFKQRYRLALDALPLTPEQETAVVAEAIAGFEANTVLFAALESANPA